MREAVQQCSEILNAFFRQLQALKGTCVYLQFTSVKLNDVLPDISIVRIVICRKKWTSVKEKRRKRVIRLAEVMYVR